MSDPLVPEVRVNKNGVPVTKHVRVDLMNPAGLKRKMPAPSVSLPPSKPRKPRYDTVRKWNPIKTTVHGSAPLRQAVSSLVPAYMYYEFECADSQAFDVMRVVHPGNVILLLAAGIRTKDEAEAFLDSKGLRGLTEDNDDLVTQAMDHGVSPQALIRMMSDLPSVGYKHENYFDAVEVHGYKVLRESDHGFSFTQKVLDGLIDIEDVRTLGAGRAASGGGVNSEVLNQLELINSGTSNMDAATLLKVITRANPRNIRSDPYTVNKTIRTARVFGPDVVLSMKRIHFLDTKLREMEEFEEDNLVLGQMVLWQDKVEVLSGKTVPAKTAAEFYKAGITVKDAANGYEEGMTLNQFLGIEAGISSSVSGGWL